MRDPRPKPELLFDQLDRQLDDCSEPADIWSCALDATISVQGAQLGNVQLLDAGRRHLTIAAQRGFRPNFLETFRVVSADDGSACGRALRDQSSVVIADVERDVAFVPFRDVAAEAGFRSVQSTPMRAKELGVIGIISTHFERPHAPTEIEMLQARLYGRAAADRFVELALGRRSVNSVLTPADEAAFSSLADLHIAEVTERIERQQRLIARLRDTQLPTLQAEHFLDVLSRSLELMLWHRRIIKRRQYD